MADTIDAVETYDIRFPTSQELDGSDAMNPDPDYSAAYVIIRTSGGDKGHGFTFTIGRGNELCVAAIRSMKHLIVGQSIDSVTSDMGQFWRHLVGDSQLRWVGPEKGVIHLATAAIVNAVWDLYAKREGKPLWKLLADMTPEQLVGCVDFRYISDALSPEQAVSMLASKASSRSERESHLREHGYPAYTTSAGWLGYSDEKLRELCRQKMGEGWSNFKIKVGRNLDDDIRRCSIIRECIGPDRKLMVDANQVWNVDEAIGWIRELEQFEPWFVEEPTSPDDILGHAAIARAVSPIRIATGEHCHNRVMFKQFMQAGAMQICQIDSCRLGGVNEVLAVILLAAHFDIPIWPHAGGVGLCEYVQHLSMFDYIAVSGRLDDRLTEYADHLHEHFVNPVTMRDGHYMPPTAPGYSAEMKRESIEQYSWLGA